MNGLLTVVDAVFLRISAGADAAGAVIIVFLVFGNSGIRFATPVAEGLLLRRDGCRSVEGEGRWRARLDGGIIAVTAAYSISPAPRFASLIYKIMLPYSHQADDLCVMRGAGRTQAGLPFQGASIQPSAVPDQG